MSDETLMRHLPIRSDVRQALDDWAQKRTPYVSGFIEAVLCNNLLQAFVRADEYNLLSLRAIVEYMMDSMPHNSWGSREAFKTWQDLIFGELRMYDAARAEETNE